jgi:nucleotide-binding universal stress UspA family protein
MYALQHAIQLTSVLKGEILVVHIVKKDTEIKEAEKRMAYEVRSAFTDPSLSFRFIARTGNIFHTIGEVAGETGALMVIMGTHGIVGMQKFLGSWALKVIASSKVPFMVVQEPPRGTPLSRVMIPVNYKRETKECVAWTNFFSKKFGSHFDLYKARYIDSYLKKGLDSNMFFLTKYFTSKGIHYEIHATTSENEFGEAAVEYAKSTEAGALLVMTTRDIGFTDYVLGAHEQFMIANSAHIPVICINPRPAKVGGGFSASGG